MALIENNAMLLMQKSLDYVWQKQRVIQENIANVETPGYKAKYVTFEDELRGRLRGTYGGADAVRNAIEGAKIRIMTSREESARLDGNNVSADAENVELARAQIQYEYLLDQINDQFTRLRTVILGQG